MKFLRRLFGCPRYEWMAIDPSSDVGYTALHEELNDGWEYGFEWVEHFTYPSTGNMIRNSHIFLRREI